MVITTALSLSDTSIAAALTLISMSYLTQNSEMYLMEAEMVKTVMKKLTMAQPTINSSTVLR